MIVTWALLEFYVSSGARASELLGLTVEDVDWGGQLIYVVSKGTRLRQPVPALLDVFRYLGRYLAADGLPSPGGACLADSPGRLPADDVLGDAPGAAARATSS